MGAGSVTARLCLGLGVLACGEDEALVFMPVPETASSARSIIYVVLSGTDAEVVARSIDDPTPYRPSVSVGEGAVALEALVFDYSLDELGLASGHVPELAPNEGVPVLSLDPAVWSTRVTSEGGEDWQSSTPSRRAAELRVLGPCPTFEVTPLDDLPFKPIALGRSDSILLMGNGQLLNLHFGDSGPPAVTSSTISMTFEPRALLLTKPDGGWISSASGEVGKFTLEPFTYEHRFFVPEYPDVLEPASGLPRNPAVAAMGSVGSSGAVLAATAGGVLGLFDESSDFVRHAVTAVSGRQARVASVVLDDRGRHLVSFSGMQGYFVYDGSTFMERSVPLLGSTGASLLARTASHGVLIFGRDTGAVLQQTASDEWGDLTRAHLDFVAVETLDLRDGFIVVGQLGELAFYSERTGLCQADPTLALLGAGGSTSAAVGDSFVRVMRRDDDTGVHKVVAVRLSG